MSIIGCDTVSDIGREAVSGTVTREELPIDAGTIMFIPAQGPATSASITAGKYSIQKENGCVPGKYQVVITHELRREAADPGTPRKEMNTIPEDRFDGKQPSGGWKLSAEVARGQTEPIDFDVK